jgi:hypothetical protein
MCRRGTHNATDRSYGSDCDVHLCRPFLDNRFGKGRTISAKNQGCDRGKCNDPGDLFGPPSSKGVHTCVKKDSRGIVCSGVTTEDKKTCDTWPVSGTPPSRAPEDIKKKMADVAADKAAADKAAAAKAAATVHECTGIKLTCGSWAAKDKNTCRTCQQALCKTENGKDVLAGKKS